MWIPEPLIEFIAASEAFVVLDTYIEESLENIPSVTLIPYLLAEIFPFISIPEPLVDYITELLLIAFLVTYIAEPPDSIQFPT